MDFSEQDVDLFGEDFEQEEEQQQDGHESSPSNSSKSVPVLPPIRSADNPGRGNFGCGRWQSSDPNDRGFGVPFLPRTGSYNLRKNYGYASKFPHAKECNNAHFVSELKLLKSEEFLSRKQIQFQKPLELACYSHVEGGDVYFDDRSLRLFRRDVGEYVGADLNEGFESFVEKKDHGYCIHQT